MTGPGCMSPPSASAQSQQQSSLCHAVPRCCSPLGSSRLLRRDPGLRPRGHPAWTPRAVRAAVLSVGGLRQQRGRGPRLLPEQPARPGAAQRCPRGREPHASGSRAAAGAPGTVCCPRTWSGALRCSSARGDLEPPATGADSAGDRSPEHALLRNLSWRHLSLTVSDVKPLETRPL